MSNHWRQKRRARGLFSALDVAVLAAASAAIIFLALRVVLLAVTS